MKLIKNKLRVNLKDWEFEFQQRNSQPILMADFWSKAIFYNLGLELKLPIKPRDSLYTTDNKGYVKKKQQAQIIKLFKKAMKKEFYAKYICDACFKRVEHFEQTAIRIKNRKNKDLLRSYKEFEKVFLVLIPWFYIPWYVTEFNIFPNRIRPMLHKHRFDLADLGNPDSLLFALITPIKKFKVQQEQEMFYKLVKLASSQRKFVTNKKFIRFAQKYLTNFAWTKTYFLLPIPPLTFNELVKRVREAWKNKFLESYELQRKKRKANQDLSEKVICRLLTEKKFIKNVRWAQEYGWLLNISIERAFIAAAQLQKFFKAVAKKLKIKYDDYILLTSDEIERGLMGKLQVSKSELVDRKIGYVYLMENGKPNLVVDKEAQNITKRVLSFCNQMTKDMQNFSGQPACHGKAIGRTKICLTPKESLKVKVGEMLVCSMTSPDYIPAMRRAAAIVTDEGGLLSHAAIVSRELGIPCVVGTKIATQVLKDDDLIEVDAIKGIIRKLK